MGRPRAQLAPSLGIDLLGIDVDAVGDEVHRALDAAGDVPLAFLHGDLQPEHVVLDDRGERVRALLDWGDASVGDPAWDIAVLTLDDPQQLDPVLDGYAAPPDERAASSRCTVRTGCCATSARSRGSSSTASTRRPSVAGLATMLGK